MTRTADVIEAELETLLMIEQKIIEDLDYPNREQELLRIAASIENQRWMLSLFDESTRIVPFTTSASVGQSKRM